MMRRATYTTYLTLILTVSALYGSEIVPFPLEITSLKLGTSKTMVTGTLARAGLPCQESMVGHDPYKVILPSALIANGIKGIRLEFARGVLSEIAIEIDHSKIAEKTLTRLYEVWLEEVTEMTGQPFLSVDGEINHPQVFWFTTNSAITICNCWPRLPDTEESFFHISISEEPLLPEDLKWRIPHLVARCHLATIELKPHIVWSDAANKLRTNNPEITKLREYMRERKARRKANAEGPTGPLGSATNPIRCHGPKGERAYLGRLRDSEGSPVSFLRSGSCGEGPYSNVLDRYEIQTGDSKVPIFMDMYHSSFVETNAVNGFTIDQE
jgi:hypothetical protein